MNILSGGLVIHDMSPELRSLIEKSRALLAERPRMSVVICGKENKRREPFDLRSFNKDLSK